MMKKSLTVLAISVVLSTNIQAAGDFNSIDSNTMNEISSGSFKLGGMADNSYGVGVSMQFAHLLDVKVGHEGGGADFHFWSMQFNKGAYLRRHVLEFYASAGLGYRWGNTGGIGEGFLLRAPAGADFQFSRNGWSCYLEIAPTFSFAENKQGLKFVSATGIRYNF